MLVTRISDISGKPHTLDLPVTLEQLDLYAKGEALLQHAFPDCDADQREFIKSGVTPAEWAAMFGVGSTLASAVAGLRGQR